jgi:peroxiredoxin
MKKYYIALSILLFLPGLALGDMLGAEAPDFTLRDLEGNPITLSNLAGNVVMLFHFNTYCHTCREEVPLINQIKREFKNLKVIGIATANDNSETREFKSKYRPEFLLVPDPEKELYEKYYVHTVPLIDIIDRTGTIRYRGKMIAYNEFKSIMDKIIEEKEMVGANIWNRPPDFTLSTTQGVPFHLYDVIGKKTILLTFLSIQDETIRQVVEVMKSLYSRYKREDLDLVRVAVRDSLEDVRKFKEKYYVNFPILLDENAAVAKSYGITKLSRTFVINKKGKIRYVSDQISLSNLESILVKLKSYFKEELPEEIIMQYLEKAAPGVQRFDRITLGDDQIVYVGDTEDKEKIIAREVFKDVLCDVCTNVHFIYSFDLKGTIKNIVLIESIDLYGEPIEAKDYLKRVIQQANKKLPLKLRKDIDAITGATQSCKLILEGLNETPQILNALNDYRDILAKIQK